MSTLQFISHHLFVAAAGQDDGSAQEPLRQESASASLKSPAKEVPLELLETGQSMPAGLARSLRTAGTSGRG